MVNRKKYMDMLTRMKDHQVIKVITGVRRCGKSTLLQMFRDSRDRGTVLYIGQFRRYPV